MKKSFLFLLPCLLALNLFAQSKTTYGSNTTVGQYAPVNGIKVYYETYGKGQPLLLLHGNGGSIKAFEKNIPFLAQNYKLVAMDSREELDANIVTYRDIERASVDYYATMRAYYRQRRERQVEDRAVQTAELPDF